jgi:hypothetical protein
MSTIAKFALSRLKPLSAVLFVCDVQQKFVPLIYNFPTLANRINLLNSVSNVLQVPVIATEQYPKVFGPTIPELQLDAAVPIFAKKKFSMMTEEVTAAYTTLNRNQVLESTTLI